MDDEIKKMGQIAVTHCEPLYLSKHLMQDGHTANKANGTMTYVKYKGVTYGITCAHVYFVQEIGSSNERILTVFGNQLIYQFGLHSENGYQSHFRPLRTSTSDTASPDIAIIQLNQPYPSIYMEKKGKEAVDLDNWTSPNWDEIKMAMACGFPTEHKSESDTVVSAELAQVIAEPASSLSPDRESFLLASSLEEDCNIYFSGMSGGPVYVDNPNDGDITLMGIVYEGTPGSSEEWNNRGAGAFLTKKDIQIRAHTFTPAIFEKWLQKVGYM